MGEKKSRNLTLNIIVQEEDEMYQFPHIRPQHNNNK
jgi:hypothetical protein